jgi:hypothetical protein
MKIKVSEAIGVQLDWLVAKCEGLELWRHVDNGAQRVQDGKWDSDAPVYSPSTDWSQGGPILSREHISRTIDHSGLWVAYWTDGYGEEDFYKKWMHCHRSELVAGLRCYVAAKLGDEVEVPDELVPEPQIKLNTKAAWPFR